MIARITALLHEESLIEPATDPKFNFLFTKGKCVVAEALVPEHDGFFIKFSAITELKSEFALLRKARTLYPDFVPQQYGCYHLPQLDIMISERIRFSSVAAPCVTDSSKSVLQSRLLEYFKPKILPELQEAGDYSHKKLLSKVVHYFGRGERFSFLNDWLASDALEGLPQTPQHGDFVHNNLGLARDKLYVFDWEDFAKINLPGFDIATFLISDTRFSSTQILRLVNEQPDNPSTYSRFIRRCCASAKLDYPLFLNLLPVYTALFLYLKREYGREIQSIVSQFLDELVDGLHRQTHISM